jgi:hypothetical protein
MRETERKGAEGERKTKEKTQEKEEGRIEEGGGGGREEGEQRNRGPARQTLRQA